MSQDQGAAADKPHSTKPAPPDLAEAAAARRQQPEPTDAETTRAGDADKPRYKSFWKEVRAFDVVNTLIALGTLIVAVIALVIASDTRDIKNAVNDISALARQTKRQADAMQGQLAEVKSQTAILASQLLVTSDTEQRTLRAYIEFAQHQYQGQPDIPLSPASDPDRRMQVWFALENMGRTPAKGLRVKAALETLDIRKPFKSGWRRTEMPISVGTDLGAGAHIFGNRHTKNPVSDAELKALTAGQEMEVLHATVVYQDVFSKEHTSSICVYWGYGSPEGSLCQGYNKNS